MKLLYFIILFFLLECFDGYGQVRKRLIAPEVGQPCPSFELEDLKYYTKDKVSSLDLKGKHIILDFISPGCSACFENLPKCSRIQQQFEPALQIFLIGKDEYNLPSIYKKYKEKQNLRLPVCYDASKFKDFDVDGVPYLVWIDDHGIVRAITASNELTRTNVFKFLKNEQLQLRDVSRLFKQSKAKDFDSTFILNLGSLQNEKLFTGSSLVSWNPNMPLTHHKRGFDLTGNKGFYQVSGMPLNQFINLAYLGMTEILPGDSLYGVCYTNPVFEMDSSLIPFQNYSSGEGMYCYSIVVPRAMATPDLLFNKMRSDLHDYLGYDVQKEFRMMPYWKLLAKPGTGERLKSIYSKTEVNGDVSGLNLKHIKIGYLVQILWSVNQDECPYIDETQIEGYIDIKLPALLTDIDDVKKVLGESGFYLAKSIKLMQVLVVRQSKSAYLAK